MPGQVSVGHCMFFGVGAYLPLLFYHHWQLPPMVGVPVGIAVSRWCSRSWSACRRSACTGHYFSMATIAVAELIRLVIGTWDFVGAAIGLQGPAVGRGWWDLTFRGELPYYYIFLARAGRCCCSSPARSSARASAIICAPSRRASAPRARLGVPVRRTKLYALMLSAAFTSIAGSLYADQDRLHRSGKRLRHPGLGADGDHRGARRRRHRSTARWSARIILIPLQTATNTWFGGGGTGLDLHSLRRHHRADRALRAGRAARDVGAHRAEIPEAYDAA